MKTNNIQRETLIAIRKAMMRDSGDGPTTEFHSVVDALTQAALAEPVKNCEVGTVAEQMKRQHDTMCNTTRACPDSDWSCKRCFAEWAQMPYEEGSKNEN